MFLIYAPDLGVYVVQQHNVFAIWDRIYVYSVQKTQGAGGHNQMQLDFQKSSFETQSNQTEFIM